MGQGPRLHGTGRMMCRFYVWVEYVLTGSGSVDDAADVVDYDDVYDETIDRYWVLSISLAGWFVSCQGDVCLRRCLYYWCWRRIPYKYRVAISSNPSSILVLCIHLHPGYPIQAQVPTYKRKVADLAWHTRITWFPGPPSQAFTHLRHKVPAEAQFSRSEHTMICFLPVPRPKVSQTWRVDFTLRLTPEPENWTLFNRGPEDMAAA